MSMSMDMDAGMSADTPGCDSMQSSSAGKAHAKAKGTACKLTAQCQFGSLYHPAARAEVSRPRHSPAPSRSTTRKSSRSAIRTDCGALHASADPDPIGSPHSR